MGSDPKPGGSDPKPGPELAAILIETAKALDGKSARVKLSLSVSKDSGRQTLLLRVSNMDLQRRDIVRHEYSLVVPAENQQYSVAGRNRVSFGQPFNYFNIAPRGVYDTVAIQEGLDWILHAEAIPRETPGVELELIWKLE